MKQSEENGISTGTVILAVSAAFVLGVALTKAAQDHKAVKKALPAPDAECTFEVIE